jgi:hypothetical protein
MDTRTFAERPLKVGDRVQLIHPIIGVSAGTWGVVLRRFTFDPLYDICFDGYAGRRLVNKHDLAAAPPETAIA